MKLLIHLHAINLAMGLDRLDFLEKFATVDALFWQTEQGGEWQVFWCLRIHQIIHDIGSLCYVVVQLLLGRKSPQAGAVHHQAVLHILPIPPLPLHLLIIIIILLLLFTLHLLLLLQEVGMASKPSLLFFRDL